MNIVKIPVDIQEQLIEEWCDDDRAIRYFHRKKLYTIGDLLDAQDGLMAKYWDPINLALLYKMLNIRVVPKDPE